MLFWICHESSIPYKFFNIQELSGVANYSQGLRNICISFVSFSIR